MRWSLPARVPPLGEPARAVVLHGTSLRRAGSRVKHSHDSCNNVLPGVPLAAPAYSTGGPRENNGPPAGRMTARWEMPALAVCARCGAGQF